MKNHQTIGFIGLGNMGYHIATHLSNAGYELIVYDINDEVIDKFKQSNKKIKTFSTPKEVSDKTSTIMVSLPTPAIVETVALGENGVINGKKIDVYIDLSTSGQEVSELVAKTLKHQNIQTLDAPVSGGVIGARQKTLSVMVAGDKQLFEAYEEIFLSIGKKALYVGEYPGQAQTMKVINNLLSSTAIAATSEALVLGAKAGLHPENMLDVLNVSSGRNSATEDKVAQYMLCRNFDYGFSIDLAYKDLKLCMDLAEKLHVPMFLGQNTTHLWRHAVSQGYGKKDFTNILNVFEDWSDVLVESKDF